MAFFVGILALPFFAFSVPATQPHFLYFWMSSSTGGLPGMPWFQFLSLCITPRNWNRPYLNPKVPSFLLPTTFIYVMKMSGSIALLSCFIVLPLVEPETSQKTLIYIAGYELKRRKVVLQERSHKTSTIKVEERRGKSEERTAER